MNNKPSSMKSWIIIAIVLIVAVAAYFIYSGSSSTGSGTIQANTDATGQLGQQVLSLLNQVSSLQMNTALFTSQAYTSLKDFSVTIPPQTVGRANPFAPIPGVSLSSSSTKVNSGK